jgi:hypothetical protein
MSETQANPLWKDIIFWTAVSTVVAVLGLLLNLQSIFFPRNVPPSPEERLHRATSGVPFFDSSKSAATQNGSWGATWDTTPNEKGFCQLKDGGYAATSILENTVKVCRSNIVRSDFALTVQMTILQGDTGGIIFHWDQQPGDYHNFYYFYIETDGSYGLYKSERQNCPGEDCILPLFSSPPDKAIKQGLGVPNDISLVVQGSTFYLYGNGQFLGDVPDNDTPYHQGYIGLASGFGPGEAVFSNPKIWDTTSGSS